jgi:hypothetical protein
MHRLPRGTFRHYFDTMRRAPHRRRAALVAVLATELALAIRFLGW